MVTTSAKSTEIEIKLFFDCTFIVKPPPVIEDLPILEDPPKSFLHSNFLFFIAKICENLKKFDGP